MLLTQVISQKRSAKRRFILVDAAMNDLLRPALYGAHHEIVPVVPRRGASATFDIVGPVCEPERMLESEASSLNRALSDEPIVERCSLLAPSLWQGLVWKCHHKPPFIILGGFHRTPVRRREIAEARNIHCPNIDRGLTIDHPFGQAHAHAAGLTEARHHTHSSPIVRHAGNWTDHRISVRAECKRPVDYRLDAAMAERRIKAKTARERRIDSEAIGW